MSDNIDIVVRESGAGQVVRSFDDIAASAQRAHDVVTRLQKVLTSIGRSTAAANRLNAMGTAAQAASQHVNNLSSAVGTLNNTRVTATLNNTRTQIQGVGTAANTTGREIRNLFGAFLTLATVQRVVGSLIQAQVGIQEIHYGLIAATGSSKGAVEQFEFVRKTADELGLSLESSAKQYTRLAASANAMNVPIEDQQRLYTSLAKASTVLHLSEEKVQFATLALTQMFSKGRIQAEELRRQLGEHIPGIVPRFQKAVMEVVKGTDMAGMSFETLMKKGLLNTKEFLPQLVAALEETGRGWEEASKGLNAEINRLRSAWFELKVEVSEGLFTSVVTGAVRILSNNLKEIAGVVAGLGAALAVAFAPVVIAKLIPIVASLWALVAAHPFVLVAAAVVGVVTAIGAMRNEILLGVDETTSLGDVLHVLGEDMQDVWSAIGEHVPMVLGFISEELWKSFKLWTGFHLEYQARDEALWLQILRFIAQTFDMIGGIIRGMYRGAIAASSIAIEVMMDGFSSLGQAAMALLKGDFEGIAGILGNQMKNVAGSGERMGEAFSDAFRTEILRQSDSGLEAALDSVIERAKTASAARLAAAKAGSTIPFTPSDPETTDPTKKSGADKAAKELERLKDALAAVIGEISPAENALKRLAQAHEVLEKSVSAGLITQSRADEIMGKLERRYRDQLDPLGAVTRKLNEQAATYQYIGDEQQARAQLMTITQDLESKGIDLTERQSEALLAQIGVIQRLNRENSIRNQILNDTVYKQRDELEKINQIGAMQTSGTITPGQAGQQAIGVFGEDAMRGSSEWYAAIEQAYIDHLGRIDAARQAGVVSEQTAAALKAQAELAYLDKRTMFHQQFFQNLAALSTSGNKKLAAIGKAAAIVSATIDGYKAIQTALAQPPGWPYNAASVIGVTVMQASNLASIMSTPTGFRTGGSMIVGGSGGPDSQLVQFNATPGEQIHVNTPAQARGLEKAGSVTQQPNIDLTVVNVKSKDDIMEVMQSGDGKHVFLNMMQEDPAGFRQALNL